MSIQVVKKEETMKSLLAAVSLDILFILFQGWTLSLLWGWYIVPTFNIPDLSVVNAIGISILVGGCLFVSIPDYRTSLEKSLSRSLNIVTVLGIGWLFHFVM